METIKMKEDSILDKTIDYSGPDSTLMISPAALDDVMANTDPMMWDFDGQRRLYRGAFVEVHDEWSWGWNVRNRDDEIIHLPKRYAP